MDVNRDSPTVAGKVVQIVRSESKQARAPDLRRVVQTAKNVRKLRERVVANYGERAVFAPPCEP